MFCEVYNWFISLVAYYMKKRISFCVMVETEIKVEFDVIVGIPFFIR